MALVLLKESLEVLEAWGASRLCDVPPAWSPVWKTVLARFQRVGALENVAEADRPSGSEELHPGKTLRVRGSSRNQSEQSVCRSELIQVEL